MSMVDFILLVFVLAVFFAGIWIGSKYGSIRSVIKKALSWAQSKTDENS